MKATIELPDGWRRVMRGKVRKTDLSLCVSLIVNTGPSFKWLPPSWQIGRRVEQLWWVIRRKEMGDDHG